MTTNVLGSADCPMPRASLIGRRRELDALRALLAEASVPLVTLIGPGGVGKTRLALQAAIEAAADFAEVVVVPLAPARDRALVLPAIARALDLSDPARPVFEQLARRLRDQATLIVLDNVEQVADAAPELAALLAGCPHLTLLATSRTPLRVSGERRFPVPPLALPDPETPAMTAETEAISLFVRRAEEADPDFTLSTANVAAVVEICRRLDGLPLAIELAAARVAVLPPAALLARLRPALPLLCDGPCDAPERHRTLREAFAWSYDLLSVEEQALFRRLAVVAGGFTLDAAGAVAGNAANALDGVAALMAQSLVERVGSSSTEEPRFRLLEPIREFALERLADAGEADATRDRHAAWCLELAHRAGPELLGSRQRAWFARLEEELGNVRAALDWLRARGDAETALRLAEALTWFWMSPGHCREGRELFEALIALPESSHDLALLADATQTAAGLADWLRDHDRAGQLYRRAAALAERSGNRAAVAAAHRGLGSVMLFRGEPDTAAAHLRVALRTFEAGGNHWQAAHCRHLLGIAAHALGDHRSALTHHEAALASWRDLGDQSYAAHALSQLALLELDGGRCDRALARGQEALAAAEAANDRFALVHAIEACAAAAVGIDVERAVQLLAASEAQLGRFAVARHPSDQSVQQQAVAQARRTLGDEIFATRWTSGDAMTLTEAAEAARAITTAGARLDSASSAGLTQRQREVLALVVQGLTDREIADQLCVAPRTASNHVHAILTHLGVPSRLAAARVCRAVRDGDTCVVQPSTGFPERVEQGRRPAPSRSGASRSTRADAA